MRNRQEPVFSIRIAARLVGLHVQTLRYYERNGMVKPQRSRGNVRYYSEEDITMINNIKALIDDLGVNLAGVQVIMKMNEQMNTMKDRIKYLESELNNTEKTIEE
ncbi:MAG: MerR family transcriptional regulator [Chloroflexota bacterium]|nr:MerR family transcriptional regulator [Chloroflexota bacterium]|tara:strand:+ start:2629 stop:2943 length:315 start_codon:yes stop_codon:yes gene_type:complete